MLKYNKVLKHKKLKGVYYTLFRYAII